MEKYKEDSKNESGSEVKKNNIKIFFYRLKIL